MVWWVLLAVIVSFLAIRNFWRTYSHPYNMLIRQAANMDWVAAGTRKSADGYRNMKLRRGNMLAEVSFKDLNVRLLQPVIQKPFRDFVELERWIGAENSNKHESTVSAPATNPSTQRKDVDYFDKVANLLAAKGVRDEFTTLQGWDKDYGEATARVCALAEHAHENPVVIAAFMLQSMDYYHKSRDVGLSYLARLESGLRAKIENPDLAAELDAEAQAKESSYELLSSININSDSPEANYIREVNDYIRSVGHYNSLVLPAQENEIFKMASANVYLSGYQTNSSPKVVGALIADGAHKYKSNPQFGILFLGKVAKNMRKRHDEALSAETEGGKAVERTKNERTEDFPANAKSMPFEQQPPQDEASTYHVTLDTISGHALTFLSTNGLLERADNSQELEKLYSELLLYLSTCKARKDTGVNIHPMNWNTFKRGVEVRMLKIRDDGHQRSGIISTPDGGKAYAQFTSTYWQKMDELEAVLNRLAVAGLIQLLLHEMGSGPAKSRQFIEFFNRLSDEAASALVPKIAVLG